MLSLTRERSGCGQKSVRMHFWNSRSGWCQHRPVLVMPRVHTGHCASGVDLGAVLSQANEGQEKVIAIASKTLTRTERKYCAMRCEMLALMWATHYLRPYLYGIGLCCAQTIVLSSGFTVLRKQRDKLPIGWSS